MRIAVAQTRPVAGDVERNIAGHLRLIDLAASLRSELVVSKHHSITGYEPALAANLATSQHDPRFKVFQDVSDRQHITIGVGAPTRSRDGLHISMILFRPNQSPYVYSKMYLHSGEEAFFVPGPESTGLICDNANVAFAICYEL
jgi:predicted amidohydrolase